MGRRSYSGLVATENEDEGLNFMASDKSFVSVTTMDST